MTSGTDDMQWPAACEGPDGIVETFWVTGVQPAGDDLRAAMVASLTLGLPFTKDDEVLLRAGTDIGLSAQALLRRSPFTTYRGTMFAGGQAIHAAPSDAVDQLFGVLSNAIAEVGCEVQRDMTGPHFRSDDNDYYCWISIRPDSHLSRQLAATRNPSEALQDLTYARAAGRLSELEIGNLLKSGQIITAVIVEPIWIPTDPIGPLSSIWE